MKKRQDEIRQSGIKNIKEGNLQSVAQTLEEQLSHAFRQGLNVSIQGLHRQAPSDHLPVSLTYHEEGHSPIVMASWNLLADVHLGNYFRNVKIVDIIEKDDFIKGGKEGNLFKQRGHWFVSYLSAALREMGNKITLNEENLRSVLNNVDFSKEHNPEKAKSDFMEIIDHYLEKDNPHREAFFQSVAHAIEINYAMSEGYLKWAHRKELIKENKNLLNTLKSKDIICLQECTSPDDILKILKEETGNNYLMVTHRVNDKTNDHCVIIYNQDKYQICKNGDEDEILKFGLNKNQKPSLLLKLESKALENPSPFIVGSVHHPGGNNNELSEISTHIEEFQKKGKPAQNVFVMGDYNHEQMFFENLPESYTIKMPMKSTMAGPDYGSTNLAIDGIFTNKGDEVKVETVQFPFAPPIELPIQIEIDATVGKDKTPIP